MGFKRMYINSCRCNSGYFYLSLLLSITEELLEVPVTILLLQSSKAQRW